MNNNFIHQIKAFFKTGNYLHQVIAVNVALFVVFNLLRALAPTTYILSMRLFGLSADVVSYFWAPWTYITYIFTHTDLNHILYNMLWLYFMGRILSDLYGQKRFLEIFMYGGISGGVLYVISAYVTPFVGVESYLIGASAGVTAVLIAIALLQPNYRLNLLILGPVELKYIALVGFIMSSIVDFNINSGGKIAHIGGAIFGAAYGYFLPKGRDIALPITSVIEKLYNSIFNRPKIKVVHKNSKQRKTTTQTDSFSQERVDQILDKISKSGYDSLSKAEKEYLFNINNK